MPKTDTAAVSRPHVKTGMAGHRSARLLAGAFALAASTLVHAAEPVAEENPGKTIYEQNCAVCHGLDGRADTPVSRLLTPRPRNFTDPIEIGRVSVDRMYLAVTQGRPGTAMSPWGQVLTEMQIGDVIDYVRGFATAGGAAPLTPQQLSHEVGRRVYAANCAACHGESGKADTETAKVLKPPPRDFTDPVRMARLDDGRLYLAILRGKPGTSMGGWSGVLAPAEIVDLMRYIRTLSATQLKSMRPGELDFLVGKEIYKTYCIGCHGEHGDAQTAVGRQVLPHPRDFTSAIEMEGKSDFQLAESIMHGVHGSAMAPWGGVLNKEDVRRVLVFIHRSFSPALSTPVQKK